MRFLFVLALAAFSSTALAEGRRDPDAALELSIAGSVAPASLFAFGLAEQGWPPKVVPMALAVGVVTPSLGEIYAGRYLTYGMAARATGFALVMLGGKNTFCRLDDTCTYAEEQHYKQMLFGGLVLYAGGMIFDVATAPRAARRYNERHLAIAPLLGSSNGIALTGEF